MNEAQLKSYSIQLGFFVGENMKLQDAIERSGPALVMGILNVTPDSFSDGGRYTQSDRLKQRIEQVQSEGADIIDIGGESTRPGARIVELQEELDRVLPALELAREYSDCWISVDTYKSEVMKQALGFGVDMINDVNALQADGAIEVCAADKEAMICLMHKQGDPKTMQQAPVYQSVVDEVTDFLNQRVQACLAGGIEKKRLMIDPGFGFGKTLEHNIELFKKLNNLNIEGLPILVGVSRKTMLGQILNLDVDQRLQASVTAAVLAQQQGTKILRVHDVKETKQALTIAEVLKADK